MKTTKYKVKVSKALEEVWQWKEMVYLETNNKNFEEIKQIYFNSLKKTAELLNAKLVKNIDGTYRFI